MCSKAGTISIESNVLASKIRSPFSVLLCIFCMSFLCINGVVWNSRNFQVKVHNRHFLMKLIFSTDIPYSNEIVFVYSISVLDNGLSVLKPSGVKKSLFRNVYTTKFCVKSIFAKFESRNCPFYNFRDSLLWILVNYGFGKRLKLTKIKFQNL